MAKRSHLTLPVLGLLVLTAPVQGGIDFTPTTNRYMSEGAEYSSVSFKDDKRKVALTLPRQWTCRGDASRLQLVPPREHSFAEGVIQAVPTKKNSPFNEATLKALAKQVIDTLPPGSQTATIIRRQENTVILDQNLSYEFVASYQTLGQTFQRSVIFVNCPGQQLIFRFSAPKAIFENLNKSFRGSICSWQWTDKSSNAKLAQKGQAPAVIFLQ
jgi:hypothetical protein